MYYVGTPSIGGCLDINMKINTLHSRFWQKSLLLEALGYFSTVLCERFFMVHLLTALNRRLNINIKILDPKT